MSNISNIPIPLTPADVAVSLMPPISIGSVIVFIVVCIAIVFLVKDSSRSPGLGLTVFLAICVAVGVSILVNEIILKDTSITANITKLQTALSSLQHTVNNHTGDITGLKSYAEQTKTQFTKIIDDIAKNSVDILSNNTNALKLINDVKLFSEALSQSSTEGMKTLQANIDALQTSLTDLSTEVKRVDTKSDQGLQALSNRIDALVDTEAKERETLKTLMNSIATQDKAQFDKIELRFPELKSTIDEIKADHESKIQSLRSDLVDNSNSDKKYRDYVDTINSYVSNAFNISDMSDKVKTAIFGVTAKVVPAATATITNAVPV